MDYFLTFEIGTTSVKTCVFDRSLRLLGHANGEYRLLTERPGSVELEPETYWRAVLDGAKSAILRAGIDSNQIVAISCTTQGETFLPVDAEGNALRNAIVWLDERAGEQAKRLSERFPAEQFYRETGLPELNGYTPVAKLLWLKEHEPDVYAKAKTFLLLEDYIVFRLTGARVCESAAR